MNLKGAAILIAFAASIISGEANASDGWTGPGLYLWIIPDIDADPDKDAPHAIIVSGPYSDLEKDKCFTKINSKEFQEEANRRWPKNAGGGCGYFSTQSSWDTWARNPQ